MRRHRLDIGLCDSWGFTGSILWWATVKELLKRALCTEKPHQRKFYQIKILLHSSLTQERSFLLELHSDISLNRSSFIVSANIYLISHAMLCLFFPFLCISKQGSVSLTPHQFPLPSPLPLHLFLHTELNRSSGRKGRLRSTICCINRHISLPDAFKSESVTCKFAEYLPLTYLKFITVSQSRRGKKHSEKCTEENSD